MHIYKYKYTHGHKRTHIKDTHITHIHMYACTQTCTYTHIYLHKCIHILIKLPLTLIFSLLSVVNMGFATISLR